jgi:uncharacterized protein YqeY
MKGKIMSLLQQIRTDQVAARKAAEKDKASLLTTLLGEAEMVGKNAGNRETTDAEVLAVIQKFLKNCNEVAKLAVSDEVKAKVLFEVGILLSYMPSQLSDEEIINELQMLEATISVPNRAALKGAIMKHFKEKFAGRYDAKHVIAIFEK